NRLSRWKRVVNYLKLASEVSSIIMSLRDKPRVADWLGIGVRVVDLSVRLREEHREMSAMDPTSYFADEYSDVQWSLIPAEFRESIMPHAHDFRLVEGYWDGKHDSQRAVVARIGTNPSERIG